MIEKARLEKIKMIALDLDGTTLTRSGLTRRTKETLEEAIRRGYKVVVATGRPYVALPESVLEIEGLEHIIISNGAHIAVRGTGEFIYSNCADASAIMKVREILMATDLVIEVFTGGCAYVDKALYEDLAANGSDWLSYRYILRTRRPVEGIYDFWAANCTAIENVNIYFRNPEEKARTYEMLRTVPGVSLTSSMAKNIEIGGETTSKASAIEYLCSLYGMTQENVMAFGDSLNDGAMIESAGIGIAMGNAEDAIREMADWTAPTNDEEGVAYTIRTMLFGEATGMPPRKSWLERLRGFLRKS